MSSSPNTDPQLLLESGPMLIRDFNPKGVLYWTGRKCVTCEKEIMDHWLRKDGSGAYFCAETGPQESEGIADCIFDVSTIDKTNTDIDVK
jgi:hypothetical protein